ncbi:hypothetical protein R5R35_005404 [Gryllus longicercus]|uniref:Uncharacterized protein n=1 Tax=Gryllus longicercus TaxID=2509291 RepID=A0AAN9Z0V4_9ORTH
MSKKRANFSFPAWVRQREMRRRFSLGYSDVFYKSLYSSISTCHSWGGGEHSRSEHGGLFSLEFCPEGSLLVAGCEKSSFLVFDPLSRKLIRTVHNAHASCVTTVKFLDSRIFATGSVDQTVSLWDARNLKSQIRTLRGHSSTIGNIEYSRKNELLITSGVDGFISTWDMKNCVQSEEFCKKIFRSYVLLRLRLNPEESKMIISTARGYLMIVHELDLCTLAQDLDQFELEMFGFAYLHETSTPSHKWNRFLSPNRRRNRLEIVADFPNADGFNVISALEIHPQGWSAISRSTSEASGIEWTCVHDIQEEELSEGGAAPRWESGDLSPPCPQQQNDPWTKRSGRRSSERGDGGTGDRGSASVGFCSPSSYFDSEILQRTSGESSRFSWRWDELSPALKAPDAASSLKSSSRRRRSNSQATVAWASSPPLGPYPAPAGALGQASLESNPGSSQVLDPHSFSSSVSTSFISSDSSGQLLDRSVNKRFPRLTHYIEEPVASEWYIESVSVSADGRLICSPFDFGFRLLSFSPECVEQSASCRGTEPNRLHVLSMHNSHSDIVLCTKFSPRHCFLVTGCYGGKIAWYQPVV